LKVHVSTPIPLPVERTLQRLGHNIALARRRRHWTQEMLAQRIGASARTVRRMEEGEPGIALHILARALHAFGELQALNQVLEGAQDMVGMMLMDEKLPKRVRLPKGTPATPDTAI